jgi:pescadillo protein
MVKKADRNFVTKGKAVKKLQLTSREFQRLCILKGVFPVEPRKKLDNKVYYAIKDIKFLAKEKLISQFRSIKAHAKKINKYKLRKDDAAVRKLTNAAPEYSLHHLLKERYPTFLDAIRDLDDALSLICLFASCPSNKDIPNELITLSERLWREFELYIMASHSVRKVFLSIKGIYYQAEIHGQRVTWLVPY